MIFMLDIFSNLPPPLLHLLINTLICIFFYFVGYYSGLLANQKIVSYRFESRGLYVDLHIIRESHISRKKLSRFVASDEFAKTISSLYYSHYLGFVPDHSGSNMDMDIQVISTLASSKEFFIIYNRYGFTVPNNYKR